MNKLDQLQKIREKLLSDKSKSLVINSIPGTVKEEFVEFAYLNFEGHYGQALKWCFDFAVKFYPRIERIETLLNTHEEILSNPQHKQIKNTIDKSKEDDINDRCR